MKALKSLLTNRYSICIIVVCGLKVLLSKTGKVRFIYKTFICLENILNKFERLSHNLMENKKEAGVSVNKYKASNVDAKKFT